MAALCGLAILAYAAILSAPQNSGDIERFDVGVSDGAAVVADALESAGFVKSSLGFKMALFLKGGFSAKIEPGAYNISKSMNSLSVAGMLLQPPYMRWITIPEGLRKEEIAELLAKSMGWSDEKKNEWINLTREQEHDYREGVYFPDTYLIPSGESPTDVVKRLRDKFEENFAPLSKEAFAQNIRWFTLLRVASIVQREASSKEDMPLIAGIIWNRLLKNMSLEVDATLQYARGDTGSGWWAPITVADKQIDSPYNTYKLKGLPPFPISNPGLDAITAALRPAKTDCLFYLHDSSKTTHCAETYDEHKVNIEKYLK